MQWYYIVLIALGGVAVLYTLVCVLIAHKLLEVAVHPKRKKATTDDLVEYLQSENPQFSDEIAYYIACTKQPFAVDGVRNAKIYGEVIPCENFQDKFVVIAHGYGCNMFASVRFIKIFHDLGYSVVIYDHRYCGQSTGNECSMGYYEADDLSCVLDYLRQTFGKDVIIGLHGESMGAVTCLNELSLRCDVDFVVADCPFSDNFRYYYELCYKTTHLWGFPIVDIANVLAKVKYGFGFRQIKPINCVADSNVPVCFIHGTADDFIRPHHSKDMFALANNSLSELHLTEGAKHAQSYEINAKSYTEIVGNFVSKVENSLRKM